MFKYSNAEVLEGIQYIKHGTVPERLVRQVEIASFKKKFTKMKILEGKLVKRPTAAFSGKRLVIPQEGVKATLARMYDNPLFGYQAETKCMTESKRPLSELAEEM